MYQNNMEETVKNIKQPEMLKDIQTLVEYFNTMVGFANEMDIYEYETFDEKMQIMSEVVMKLEEKYNI